MPAIRGSKKGSDRAITPVVEAVATPAHCLRQGPHKPSSCTSFTLNSLWGRAATGKRSLTSMRAGSLRSCPTLQPCRLWPARLLCQGGRFSRQEYWSVLANTGRQKGILLEHCISCCPSQQLHPCNPSSCTYSTPGPHKGKPKSSRAASGANPSG